MTGFSLGVDVNTKVTAMVVVGQGAVHDTMLVHHRTGEQGPRRLMMIREAVRSALAGAHWRVDVAAVEIPVNHHRSWPLESAASVVQEAVQAHFPHAIVLDPEPSHWQEATIGAGRDAKPRSLAHARANGLETDDDNLADAYCLAEYARELYLRDVVGVTR